MSATYEPLVSIITPTLNAARFLAEALRSVQEQDYPHVEHVVVDGGSTDGTLQLLERAPRVQWHTGRDGGMYDAINRGFTLARGEIVAYLNADDRYVPGAITRVVTTFARSPEAEVVHGRFRYIEEDGRMSQRRAPRGGPVRLEDLARCNCLPPHSTFVRRRVVADEGLGFDSKLQFAGDWEWAVRMARAGKRFVYIDDELSEFRLHERSKTRTVGFAAKLAEWHAICRRYNLSLARLLWHESLWGPMRRRLGLSL